MSRGESAATDARRSDGSVVHFAIALAGAAGWTFARSSDATALWPALLLSAVAFGSIDARLPKFSFAAVVACGAGLVAAAFCDAGGARAFVFDAAAIALASAGVGARRARNAYDRGRDLIRARLAAGATPAEAVARSSPPPTFAAICGAVAFLPTVFGDGGDPLRGAGLVFAAALGAFGGARARTRAAFASESGSGDPADESEAAPRFRPIDPRRRYDPSVRPHVDDGRADGGG